MRLVKQALAKPQVRNAFLAFGKVCLDKFLDCAIIKLRTLEDRLREEANTIDAEWEVKEDHEKDVRNL